MQTSVIAALRSGNPKSCFQRCYTLVEIIAVIMILALVTGMAVSALRATPVFVTLNSVANEIRELSSDARQSASTSGKVTSVFYHSKNNTVSSQDESITIPDSVKLYCGDRDLSRLHEKQQLFLFFPDGTGAEQKLTLKYGDKETILFLSPLTGRIYLYEN